MLSNFISKVNDIISYHNLDVNNIEIEYRLKIDKSTYLDAISKLSEVVKPERKVYTDYIANVKDSRFINTNIVISESNNDKKCTMKYNLYNIRLNNDIKLSASYEKDRSMCSINPSLIRKKDRLSYIIDYWKYDLTFVNDTYELEIEYINKSNINLISKLDPFNIFDNEFRLIYICKIINNKLDIIQNSITKCF